MKTIPLIGLFAGISLLVSGVRAQASSNQSIDDEIQMLRKDLKSTKKQLVAANMRLTDAEAQQFWPVYDQFTEELSKINDTKVALIKEYASNYGAITDDQADQYLQARAAAENAAMQLRLKYIPLFRKVLPGKSSALFFQIEWRVNLLIDLQLASGMPLIEP